MVDRVARIYLAKSSFLPPVYVWQCPWDSKTVRVWARYSERIRESYNRIYRPKIQGTRREHSTGLTLKRHLKGWRDDGAFSG